MLMDNGLNVSAQVVEHNSSVGGGGKNLLKRKPIKKQIETWMFSC